MTPRTTLDINFSKICQIVEAGMTVPVKVSLAAAFILTMVLTLIPPSGAPLTAAAQTDCVQPLTYEMFDSDGSFVDVWIDEESTDCASMHRPVDEDTPRDGIYLARYYTFSMSETADVAITLVSPIDTYLYLLEGIGMDGTVLYKNDDIDLAARNFNARILATLDAGDYTIEATTYDPVYSTPVIEFTLTVSGITPQPSPEGDRAALAALYHSTGGDNWYRSDNWLTDAPLDDWHGVETNGSGRVTALHLNFNNLTGSLPSELGDLSELQVLNLQVNNSLVGTIPPQLGNLVNLQELRLNDCELMGEIPPEIGNLTNLKFLSIGVNQLTGEIPPELGDLSELQVLSLWHNQLEGAIPPQLGNLANLRELWLHDNVLTGEIPPALARLDNLELLYLKYNRLTDAIPSELGNLANLRELWLGNNGLVGDGLSGEIPPELGNLVNLQELLLFANELSGEIPPELGNLANLRELRLGSNQLTGTIPVELSLPSNLKSLSWRQSTDRRDTAPIGRHQDIGVSILIRE